MNECPKCGSEDRYRLLKNGKPNGYGCRACNRVSSRKAKEAKRTAEATRKMQLKRTAAHKWWTNTKDPPRPYDPWTPKSSDLDAWTLDEPDELWRKT